MSSDLWLREGVYNPLRRFSFTNISDEDFYIVWGKARVKVAPKETVELPHHLAVKSTTELVDKIMIGEQYAKLEKIRETRPDYLYPPGAGMLGVPAARKPYEDKILKELPMKDDTATKLQVLRMKEEIESDIKRSSQPSPEVETIKVSEEAFAELKERPAATINETVI